MAVAVAVAIAIAVVLGLKLTSKHAPASEGPKRALETMMLLRSGSRTALKNLHSVVESLWQGHESASKSRWATAPSSVRIDWDAGVEMSLDSRLEVRYWRQ